MPPEEHTLILSGVTIRPGDTLIVGVSAKLSAERAAILKDRVLSRLPALADCVVIGGDVSALAAFRPPVADQ